MFRLKKSAAKVLLLIVVTLALSGVAHTSGAFLHADANTGRYLEARRTLIQQFTKENGFSDGERAAIETLAVQLRAMIGPVHVDGFSDAGESAITSLRQFGDTDFGHVDGLLFAGVRSTLFVSARSLLQAWARDRHVPATDVRDLSKHEPFYGAVFDLWAGVSHFLEIPIVTGNETINGRAFLSQEGQDVGPFPPSVAYLFIEKGERVFVARYELDLPQIARCEAVWNGVAGDMKSSAPEVIDSRFNKAFESYRSCYANRVKREPIYATLLKEIQTISDRIEKQ